MKLDWNDLRVFLAVARYGSTKRAAAALLIDQTTCARRIVSLEATVGLHLFERRPTGFALTDDGKRVLPIVEEMGRAADIIVTLAEQAARGVGSVLRISVGDLLVEPVIQPALTRYRKKWPNVRVDLAVENRYVDIMNGEADFAIRPGTAPDDPNLIVRRLGDNPVAIYCTDTYVQRYGLPKTIAEHVARPFACMEGKVLNLLTTYFPDHRPAFVVSTLQPLLEAVASGEFAALLPSMHADRVPGFIRCFPIETDTGSVWLIYHPRLRGQKQAQDLAKCLADQFKAWAHADLQSAPTEKTT